MKTLGIDLGTNSIGLALNDNNSFDWYGVYTFKKGVGEGKSGEFSLAAERTKNRASRRLYNARRYRKWETLKILIDNDFCPLSKENLNKWIYYKKGEGRVFPVSDESFSKWIKLDFNNDGAPDYSSPYQLRRHLITERLDLTIKENRYKIGRALYHIAQRRGFKSSRKGGSNEEVAVFKGSDETKTIGRNEYENIIAESGSLGAAFAYLEDNGIRVRNRYTLRKDYQNEVRKIFEKQGLNKNIFAQKIEKAIFFQRPLRSQKGLVGKCTLEPNKPRCPISHPKFEEYRAWSLLNNIKYRENPNEKFKPLPIELKEKIYNSKFFYKSKRDFKFIEIRKVIQAFNNNWEINYSRKMDETTVPSCYVSAKLKSVFGENWVDFHKSIKKLNKSGNEVTINYSIMDIWHILFSYDDEECLTDFLYQNLGLNDEQIKDLTYLFNSFPVGYANLSLKAINNILPFLRKGIIYTEAVILAKIPEVVNQEVFYDNEDEIIKAIEDEIEANQFEKTAVAITNNLIFKYHTLDHLDKFAYKDFTYELTQNDLSDVNSTIVDYYGEKTWANIEPALKKEISEKVSAYYQSFFNDIKREYIKPPHLVKNIKQFLKKSFPVTDKILDKIYHPSQIDIYPKKEGQIYLQSPKTGAFKNPMAYKTLYKLRAIINNLIETDKINEDTRIVVEVARELNDSNKRWAIEKYQRNRENENIEFSNAISELIKDSDFGGIANPYSNTDNNKFRLWTEQTENPEGVFQKIQEINKKSNLTPSEKSILKYRLWKEQNCICIYTGRIISLANLFDQNIIDFEHTIPRSKSFDNSLSNLTVCYADYNRDIKNNRLPTELPNYDVTSNGFTAIKPRLYTWEEKVKSLYNQVEFWKSKSRNAMDKASKDEAIRQKHIKQMDYEYWKNKVNRFNQTEISNNFINSQLTDTQIISKYAFHYLKTVFNNVEVQRGTVTAQFRKIYGIESNNKNRDKHTHHAIDAAVLTLIPRSKKREEILKKAYENEEKHLGQYTVKPFSEFNYSMIQEIKNNTLINNMQDQDRTLAPSKKKLRKNGKVVYIKDKYGKRSVKIQQGNSVRGQLHKESFYGKNKVAAKNEDGSLQRNDDGSLIYEKGKTGTDKFIMVKREPIESVNFENDNIIDIHLAKHLKLQIKDGVPINELKDFQGNIVRRLRCEVKAGRGTLDPEKVTIVKEQTYKSKKDYKNYYYSNTGDNYMFGLYENENGRKIVSINIFQAIQYSLNKNHDSQTEIFKVVEPIKIGRGKKEKEASLKHIFQVGQKMLFFFERKEELTELTKEQLSNRLYFIKRFHQAENGNIVVQHHLEARSEEELKKEYGPKGTNGFTIKDLTNEFTPPRILFTPTKDVFVIEGKDFEFELTGDIKFNF